MAYSVQDLWDGLHDGLMLPRCRVAYTPLSRDAQIIGQKSTSGHTYTQQLNVHWAQRESDAGVLARLYDLADEIAAGEPVAFAYSPVPSFPLRTARLQSTHSPVRVRLITGANGPYPFTGLEPFEEMFRMDVLLAESPDIILARQASWRPVNGQVSYGQAISAH